MTDDMKHTWTDDIKDRMRDYETELPADLWNRINAGMQQLPAKKNAPARKKPVLILHRSLDAAAIVAAALTAGYLAMSTNDNLNINTAQIASKVNTVRAEENLNASYAQNTDQQPQDQEPAADRKNAISRYASNFLANAIRARAKSSQENNLPENATVSTAAIADPTTEYGQDNDMLAEINAPAGRDSLSADNNNAQPYNSLYTRNRSNTSTYADNRLFGNKRTNKRKGGLEINLHSSGSMNYAFNSGSATPGYTGGKLSSLSYPANAVLQTRVPTMSDAAAQEYSDNLYYSTEEHHRQPVRMGLSFAYRLSDRIALEAGLNYTNLTTDYQSGTKTNYKTGTQKLHYIGIPVNVKFRAFSVIGFDFYLTGGAEADKCVSAKLREHHIEYGLTKKTTTNSLREKPLQWSVNGGIGAQYNITDNVGIYAEPSVSYFFDDGTSINTIYKEKPWNFSLNLGLRFSID